MLEVPLTVRSLSTVSVVICCDLSKPQNCLASVLKWLKIIKNIVDSRLRELQSTDSSAAKAIRQSGAQIASNHERDSNRMKSSEISLFIVANKYDIFKSQSSADRRCLMQVYYCIVLYCTVLLSILLYWNVSCVVVNVIRIPILIFVKVSVDSLSLLSQFITMHNPLLALYCVVLYCVVL